MDRDSDSTASPTDDADPATLAARLHDHLSATAERPVERSASRWLGEAEAVAADAAREDATDSVIAKRAGQVADLLGHVEGTGDPEADEHVVAARDLAARVVERAGGDE